jgi:ech hydrogenase subunit F
MELLRNLLRNSLSKPVTRRYPFEAREPFVGNRGMLEMNPENCSYCGVCAKRCPTNAITVIRKPSKTWSFHPHQCIVCGYCVEICPKDCLQMSNKHRGPTF